MSKKYIINILIIFISIFFVSCSQKIIIKSIKSSKIANEDIKQIAILEFKNDYIGQSEQINNSIYNLTLNGEKYFNVIDRNNLNRIMQEKKLNDSGLVDAVDYSDTGLLEIKAFISGSVNNLSKSTSYFRQLRTNYNRCLEYALTKNNKKYCKKHAKYYISCKKANYNLSTSVKLIKVINSKQLFSKTYTSSSSKEHCNDDNNVLPSKKEMGVILSKNIAKQLVFDIAPSYIYYSVKLFEKPDIKYSSKSKKQLKLALTLIENKRIKQANKILKDLNKYTNNKSYVALYNYAITSEALGNLTKALELYKMSDKIYIQSKDEINKDISKSILRVKKSIIELERTKF